MTRLLLIGILGVGLTACGGPSSTVSRPTAQGQSGLSGTSSASAHLNAIRAQVGLAPIRRNAALDAAARGHADDMAQRGFFGHRGSGGSTVGQRATAAGYGWCTVAENIGKGFSGQDDAIDRWRGSSGHYRNMTKRRVRDYGLAQTGDVWVLVLAGKSC